MAEKIETEPERLARERAELVAAAEKENARPRFGDLKPGTRFTWNGVKYEKGEEADGGGAVLAHCISDRSKSQAFFPHVIVSV